MNNLEIVYLPFASLVPSPNNSRAHSPAQIAQIAASIKKFGFNNPIAIDEKRNILAGEGRYLAVRSLPQFKKNVPTICLSHLTESQRRAYIIADNQIALNSTWDPLKLSKEIGQLMNADFDISTLGFDNDQITEILKSSSGIENITGVGAHTRTLKNKDEKQEGKGKIRQLAVLVMCKDAADQAEVFGQLTDQGFTCQNTVI